MIRTTRTPLRVSFFGGGTDYPEYFKRSRGAVIGMAIDKYIYISALCLGDYVDYRYRVSYSRLEQVATRGEIQHPAIRAALEEFGIDQPLDISTMADLPANSGLGSSSTFAVGLINLLANLQDRNFTKLDLARRAIALERDVLHENVGVQDQLHAAFGGINRFNFEDGRFSISPILMTEDSSTLFNRSLMLVYTGIRRHASKVLDEQIAATSERRLDQDLSHLLTLVDEAVRVLERPSADGLLEEFGVLMHEGWLTKRRLSSRVSVGEIDLLYDACRDAGAIGGKLCGAGGGGFLLMVVPPEKQAAFIERIGQRRVVRIGLDTQGSILLRS